MTLFFTAELKDTEHVCRLEIPPHLNDIELLVKGMKPDLPIFRRPKRPVNEYRNPMTIGLLRGLCGEVDKDVITQYHDGEPFAGNPSASVFATSHGEHFSSSPRTMPAKKLDCSGSILSARRNGRRACYQESSVFGHYYL
jgi:hypothetical protein